MKDWNENCHYSFEFFQFQLFPDFFFFYYLKIRILIDIFLNYLIVVLNHLLPNILNIKLEIININLSGNHLLTKRQSFTKSRCFRLSRNQSIFSARFFCVKNKIVWFFYWWQRRRISWLSFLWWRINDNLLIFIYKWLFSFHGIKAKWRLLSLNINP